MIRDIIKAVGPYIEALPWVDVYGGIVYRIGMANIVEGKNTGTEYYPVMCNVSEMDCTTGGRYLELAPDDSKKSVVFWYAISDARVEQGQMGGRSMADTVKITQDYKAVIWLNLPKLGRSDCFDPMLAAMDIIHAVAEAPKLSGDFFFSPQIEVASITTDPEAAFRDFAFSGLTLYPYSAAAVTYRVSMIVGHKCPLDSWVGSELSCIKY